MTNDLRRNDATFIDRPELTETFADSVHGVSYDGDTLRLLLGVSRMGEPAPGRPPTVEQYPCARLVLSRAGAVALLNTLHRLRQQLVAEGELKPDAGEPTATAMQRPN